MQVEVEHAHHRAARPRDEAEDVPELVRLRLLDEPLRCVRVGTAAVGAREVLGSAVEAGLQLRDVAPVRGDRDQARAVEGGEVPGTR